MIVILISVDIHRRSIERETDCGSGIICIVGSTAREERIGILAPLTGVVQCCEIGVFDGVICQSCPRFDSDTLACQSMRDERKRSYPEGAS